MTNMATRVQSVTGQRRAYVEHVMKKKMLLFHKKLQPFRVPFEYTFL